MVFSSKAFFQQRCSDVVLAQSIFVVLFLGADSDFVSKCEQGREAQYFAANGTSTVCSVQLEGKRLGSAISPPGRASFSITELHREPGAWIVDEFLEDHLADHVLSYAPPPESDVWSECTGGVHYETVGRKCAHVPVDVHDARIQVLLARIEKLWGVQMPEVGPHRLFLPMLQYAPGAGAMGPHQDTYVAADGSTDGGPDVSFLIYLTDTPAETARTLFPRTGVEVQPRKGRVLTWLNIDPETRLPHDNAEHAVEPLPLTVGYRYALSIPVKLFDESGAQNTHVRMDLTNALAQGIENVVMVAGAPTYFPTYFPTDVPTPPTVWGPSDADAAPGQAPAMFSWWLLLLALGISQY